MFHRTYFLLHNNISSIIIKDIDDMYSIIRSCTSDINFEILLNEKICQMNPLNNSILTAMHSKLCKNTLADHVICILYDRRQGQRIAHDGTGKAIR